MDILTVLEAAHAPLTIEEIKEFSGLMYSDERLDSLIRTGDIQQVEGIPNVYYAVPPALRKRKAGKCFSPLRSQERTDLIKEINHFREKLQTITEELNALLIKKDSFPTQEQLSAHRERLHQYNEAKDLGILLLGHLAELTGVKVQSLYDDFEIGPDD